MEIFDVSHKEQPKKIYLFGEVFGVTGLGDVTYNSRRSILGAMPVTGGTAYHLFTINTSAKTNEMVKLNRKSKWPSQYRTQGHEFDGNWIASLDFNPSGESIATIDGDGVCLVSDVDTSNYDFYFKFGSKDNVGRCRWSTNTDEPLLFIKYGQNKFNILDVEKKALTLKNPIQLGARIEDLFGGLSCTMWIDVCQSDGNLLAAGGFDRNVKIFDKRESKIVKTFDGIHSSIITCVRWNPSGDMLASSSNDATVNLLDFKAEKVLYTGETSDEYDADSICFI